MRCYLQHLRRSRSRICSPLVMLRASECNIRTEWPCARGGRGKGKGNGRARDGDASIVDLAGERIVQQRTSGPLISAPLYLTTGHESSAEPHDPVHTDHQHQSSSIRGPRQTASSSARVVQEMHQYVDLPPVIPTEMLVTPPEIAPRTRPSSSTADLSPIPLEYSSITIRADTYRSPRLQYRSYIPHSPFSTTVVRKSKDLDEEAYSRWLDSGESVNVGAACGASASWFLMLQDASTLIDAEHLDAYMGILQFDPGFVGVRWLDDWAAQTVLVHTSYLRKGGPLSIDDEDLDFLVSHIHGLRPFWGDHHPWWELREVLTIWNTSPESSCGHCLVLRIRLEEGIIIMHDSLTQEEDAYLKLRSQQSLCISFLIPTILQRSGFYEHRIDMTLVHQFRVAIAKKDLSYVHDDSTSCGALSIRTLESLVQHSFSHGKTETDIYAFGGRMARAIWRFSNDADTVVCDPTSLFIQFDDRD
ncbi:hypothetical protein OROMI_006460 [Orobanche minor]